jgi:hypothetical protein
LKNKNKSLERNEIDSKQFKTVLLNDFISIFGLDEENLDDYKANFKKVMTRRIKNLVLEDLGNPLCNVDDCIYSGGYINGDPPRCLYLKMTGEPLQLDDVGKCTCYKRDSVRLRNQLRQKLKFVEETIKSDTSTNI